MINRHIDQRPWVAHDVTAAPQSCPRCASVRVSKRPGAEWCCWELALLKSLMSMPAPATMRELTGAHFIGRSAKAIDAACRRYGFKIPLQERNLRRRRCPACALLFQPVGRERCCRGCSIETTPEQRPLAGNERGTVWPLLARHRQARC